MSRGRGRIRRLAGFFAACLLLFPLEVTMETRAGGAAAPPGPAEDELSRRLSRHVQVLAGEIGERNLSRYPALQEAARYLSAELAGLGYAVREEAYVAAGKEVKNLEAELPGRERGVIIVGAHYDSVAGSPGANDNGSGVAALLEIARLLAGERLSRTVRFVFFVNEEPPFFKSDLMGSRVYARRAKERGDRIVGMLSLETIGYYSDRPGSQRYPFPLNLLYPSTGNFIGFVGNVSSLSLVRQAAQSFRRATPFPAEWAAVPGGITGVDWSDHWSFWQEGYRALMVTDTALFRYPYYHSGEDLPRQLDYPRLARVTAGLAAAVRELGG